MSNYDTRDAHDDAIQIALATSGVSAANSSNDWLGSIAEELLEMHQTMPEFLDVLREIRDCVCEDCDCDDESPTKPDGSGPRSPTDKLTDAIEKLTKQMQGFGDDFKTKTQRVFDTLTTNLSDFGKSDKKIGTMGAAGVGTGLGAGAGTIIAPVIGTAVGAALGAMGGIIVSALAGNKDKGQKVEVTNFAEIDFNKEDDYHLSDLFKDALKGAGWLTLPSIISGLWQGEENKDQSFQISNFSDSGITEANVHLIYIANLLNIVNQLLGGTDQTKKEEEKGYGSYIVSALSAIFPAPLVGAFSAIGSLFSGEKKEEAINPTNQFTAIIQALNDLIAASNPDALAAFSQLMDDRVTTLIQATWSVSNKLLQVIEVLEAIKELMSGFSSDTNFFVNNFGSIVNAIMQKLANDLKKSITDLGTVQGSSPVFNVGEEEQKYLKEFLGNFNTFLGNTNKVFEELKLIKLDTEPITKAIDITNEKLQTISEKIGLQPATGNEGGKPLIKYPKGTKNSEGTDIGGYNGSRDQSDAYYDAIDSGKSEEEAYNAAAAMNTSKGRKKKKTKLAKTEPGDVQVEPEKTYSFDEHTGKWIDDETGKFYDTNPNEEHKSDGGWIPGQDGVGADEDDVDIKATKGEYMINKKSARKYRHVLDDINKDHFATGGSIGGHYDGGGTVVAGAVASVGGAALVAELAALSAVVVPLLPAIGAIGIALVGLAAAVYVAKTAFDLVVGAMTGGLTIILSVFTAFSTLATAIVSLPFAALKFGLDMFNAATDVMSKFANGDFFGAIGAASKMIVNSFTTVGNVLIGWIPIVGDLFGKMTTLFTGVIDAFTNFMNTFIPFVSQISPSTMERYNQQVKNLQATLGVAFQGLVEIMADTVAKIGGVLLPVAQELAPLFNELGEMLQSIILPVFKAIAALISSIVAPLREAFGGLRTIIVEVVKGFVTFIAIIARMLGANDFLQRLQQNLQRPDQQGAIAVGSANMTSFENIGRDMAVAAAQASTGGGTIQRSPSDIMADVLVAIQSIRGEEIPQLQARLQTMVDNAMAEIGRWITNLWENIPRWLGVAFDRLEPIFTPILTRLWNTISDWLARQFPITNAVLNAPANFMNRWDEVNAEFANDWRGAANRRNAAIPLIGSWIPNF